MYQVVGSLHEYSSGYEELMRHDRISSLRLTGKQMGLESDLSPGQDDESKSEAAFQENDLNRPVPLPSAHKSQTLSNPTTTTTTTTTTNKHSQPRSISHRKVWMLTADDAIPTAAGRRGDEAEHPPSGRPSVEHRMS
ncbi:hypothetical protein EYF80_025248 [Liparis tanakae]|uniref:Uncharacterized protein n=1 Tax=Liparis tanakae TaxID=230148 RepID=A0A4Z2HG36_9TELE|nr:hypothetical protein EYF80_025248 [Liparis tanakae]